MNNYEYKGLGPNKNSEDWIKLKEKKEKMIEYSEKIKVFINLISFFSCC